MNVLRFNNAAEMQAYLIQAQADADASLHPAQRAITWGDTWVRFIDVAAQVVEFGRVFTQEEVAEQEVAAGGTNDDVAQAVADATVRQQQGYLFGVAFSIYNTMGEAGYTHKSNVWPIEGDVFDRAAERNWIARDMPMSAKINVEAAFRAYRGRGR